MVASLDRPITAVQTRREVLKSLGLSTGAILITAGLPGSRQALGGTSTAGRRPRWGFLIDLDRCIGCKACAVACKTEFGVPLGVFRSSVKELEYGKYPSVRRSFLPWLCNHCANPICITDCPVDEIDAEFVWPDGSKEPFRKRATYQRPDGIVVIDQDRCVGCGACVDLCPYKVRFLNPAKRTISEDAVDDHPAEKCDLCQHRLKEGFVPACVNTCQAKARLVGDLNDPASEIAQAIKSRQCEVLLPEKGTNPQCRYLALNAETYSAGRDTR